MRAAAAATHKLGLAVRGGRCRGQPQVELFWTGPCHGDVDVFRNGQRIATVAANGYTDRPGDTRSGRHRYHVRELATGTRSNEAVVIFRTTSQPPLRPAP
jgi:hypothetical protein